VLRTAVDLDACDREPVHVIGAIQPHGALIAADAVSQYVTYVSANAAAFLGMPAERLLGAALGDVLGPHNAAALLERPLDPLEPDLLKPWFVRVEPQDAAPRTLECLPHRHDGQIVLEFLERETGTAELWDEDGLRQRIISELIRPDALDELAHVSAEIVRAITGFDRVMIYRFAEDKHGEVIAESTVRADSFLGLHYPASDIPDPARRHFVLNVIRAISDINAEPVPILMRGGAIADAASVRPLDLTYSKLRAVAPVHIEYLNNMGVRASMSISLITNNQLWGLVACHHYSPRHISSSRVRFAELLGSMISALLQSLENTVQLRQSIRAEKVAFGIESEVRAGKPLLRVLKDRTGDLLACVGAQGIVLRLGGDMVEIGAVPSPLPDLAPLRRLMVDGVATSHHLSSLTAMAQAQWQVAAGAAYLELSDDGADWMVLLREHWEQTIKWAGKPEKIERRQDDGTTRLSPRGSFALWREERVGQSRPFSDSDKEALRIVRRALFALNSLERERAAVLAQKEAEAEEARLRLALLDAARRSSLGELASALAHELSQPLAAVTNYVGACRQEIRNSGVPVPPLVDSLIREAIDEASRAADLVRRLRDFIAQGDLVADTIDLHAAIRQGLELALVSAPGPRPELRTEFDDEVRAVWADAVQIGQVVLNLARNSIAAMQGTPERTLIVTTRRAGRYAEVSVRDTGHGIPPDLEDSLFEPFHRSTTRGMGIGLSLCRSIVEAHGGRIWMARGGSGAEIIFSLPIRGVDNGDAR